MSANEDRDMDEVSSNEELSDLEQEDCVVGDSVEAQIELFIKAQLRHEEGGGVRLTKQKSEHARNKFFRQYYIAYLEMRSRPYYDEVADGKARAEYYAVQSPDQLDLGPFMQASANAPPVCPSVLYDRLNALLSSTYRPSRRRVPLWAVIDRHEDGALRCAYSGASVEPPLESCCAELATGTPSAAIPGLGRLQKADEEHVTPQSWHRGSSLHPGRDMMQIFVVCKKANGSRGNRLFGLSPGAARTEKTGGYVTPNLDPDEETGGEHAAEGAPGADGTKATRKGKAGAKKATKKATKKKKKKNLFCPKINAGAVARAVLYTLVCYRHTFHKEYFSTKRLEWLVVTASTEPVSRWELHRHAELARLQGARNPFVDFPHWARLVNFDRSFAKVV
eukprot:CAMPEP_0119157838 /NCGR_PEP_ID=MMETSP1310-20130426/52959_1 /TAXON_ID=464262 /ORGANISM="Genus nov. species nov., Strain RCC2339" /LENGTH=391 /DNA_ID=CAMNT_0007150457 /DNA_START=215 /DNA_END=1389 /DNA_ORIENTATION=+